MTTDNDTTAKRLGECTDAAMKEAEARDALKGEMQVATQAADAAVRIDAAVEAHLKESGELHTPYQEAGSLS